MKKILLLCAALVAVLLPGEARADETLKVTRTGRTTVKPLDTLSTATLASPTVTSPTISGTAAVSGTLTVSSTSTVSGPTTFSGVTTVTTGTTGSAATGRVGVAGGHLWFYNGSAWVQVDN